MKNEIDSGVELKSLNTPKMTMPNTSQAMAMETLKKVMASTDPYQGKLKPYAHLVETLSAELSRLHETINLKVESRESHYDDDKFMAQIQTAFQNAIGDYIDALDRLNPRIEIKDYSRQTTPDTQEIPF